jgi:hypothetical protein
VLDAPTVDLLLAELLAWADVMDIEHEVLQVGLAQLMDAHAEESSTQSTVLAWVRVLRCHDVIDVFGGKPAACHS